MASGKRITREQLARIVRRLLVLASIFVYIGVSFQAAISSYKVLNIAQSPLTTFATLRASLIADYLGHSTISESKLVADVLAGDTTPRTSTFFLETSTTVSTTGCSAAIAANYNATLYSNRFLRYGFATLVTRGAYNLTYLLEYELIAPVIDCTLESVAHGDQTRVRVFYLLRRLADKANVSVLTVTMAVQNYVVPLQHEEGAAVVATLFLLNDMQSQTPIDHRFAVALGYPYEVTPQFEIYTLAGETVDSKWILQSVPRDPRQEQTKVIYTATLRGLYLREWSVQSNIQSMHWLLPTTSTTPTAVVRDWTWQGHTVIHDNWAWTHYIHVLFGGSTSISVAVLFVVMYRNAQLGKIWIGDAFASVANSLMLRGVCVLVSIHFNEYWALTELCFAAGIEVSGEAAGHIHHLFVFDDILHADVLTLFLCSAHVLGVMTKSRIDPAFAILVFELMFQYRIAAGTAVVPAGVHEWFVGYTAEVVASGMKPLQSLLASVSPMRLWSPSAIPLSNKPYLLVALASCFLLAYVLVIGFVVACKVSRRWYPDQAYRQHTLAATASRRLAKHNTRANAVSERASTVGSQPDLKNTIAEAAAIEQPKRTFTQFEIATGAELQNRFGVMSAYDNFVYFKGMKFASADGIYANGFVIANGKFLIATEDIVTIVTMKLVRRRLRNVYTYQVDGSKLKQTAQLVYPETLSWADLLHLNVSILS